MLLSKTFAEAFNTSVYLCDTMNILEIRSSQQNRNAIRSCTTIKSDNCDTLMTNQNLHLNEIQQNQVNISNSSTIHFGMRL